MIGRCNFWPHFIVHNGSFVGIGRLIVDGLFDIDFTTLLLFPFISNLIDVFIFH